MFSAIIMREMTVAEIRSYIQFSEREYAQGMLMQGEYPSYEAALVAAKNEINYYYNRKRDGEAHHAYYLVNAQTGLEMGLLAFSILTRQKTGAAFVFVDYISIFPDFRRRGYARYAMLWLETWVRKHGFHTIDLNVMQHKKGAIALYQSLGYEIFAERALGLSKEPGRYDMRKELAHAGA